MLGFDFPPNYAHLVPIYWVIEEGRGLTAPDSLNFSVEQVQIARISFPGQLVARREALHSRYPARRIDGSEVAQLQHNVIQISEVLPCASIGMKATIA